MRHAGSVPRRLATTLFLLAVSLASSESFEISGEQSPTRALHESSITYAVTIRITTHFADEVPETGTDAQAFRGAKESMVPITDHRFTLIVSS